MSLALGHTSRGVVSVPAGRMFAIQAPVDCWISISTNAAGDAQLSNYQSAWILAGKIYTFLIPAAFGSAFLSGLTTAANGDTTPTQLTFIDSGASGI